jgi:hypothetical protein
VRETAPSEVSFFGRRRWLGLVLCLALLAAAAAVRVRGARNDLWLDEIVSLQLVEGIFSPWQIFTDVHDDTNHYLNSLYLYFLGPRGNWPGCRAASVLFGIGAVMLAGLIGRRRSPACGLLAMLTTGFSYVLVLYSSEARGYSAVVFFSYLSYYLLESYLRTPRWWIGLMFSLSAILGFLAHLTFAFFFAAAVLWSVCRLARSGQGWRSTALAGLACFALPTAFLALLYFVSIRFMTVGGGTATSLAACYAAALAWALGAPGSSLGIPWPCVASGGLLACGLLMLWREGSDAWVFFLSVIVVVPILSVVIHGDELLYVRHFIVSIAFLLLLGSFVMGALWRQGRVGKAICGSLLVVYLALNGWQTNSLFRYGRGQSTEALRFLARHSSRPVVTVGSDRDNRILYPLRFLGPTALEGKAAAFVPSDFPPHQGPEWIILTAEPFEGPDAPGRQLHVGADDVYQYVTTFQTAPLSGLHWHIYRSVRP